MRISTYADPAHHHRAQLSLPHSRGELDRVGWDQDVLCFIEVKTRTTHDVKPAEAAVDYTKQKEAARVAREFSIRSHVRASGDSTRFPYTMSAVSLHLSCFKMRFPYRTIDNLEPATERI